MQANPNPQVTVMTRRELFFLLLGFPLNIVQTIVFTMLGISTMKALVLSLIITIVLCAVIFFGNLILKALKATIMWLTCGIIKLLVKPIKFVWKIILFVFEEIKKSWNN